MCLVLSNTLYYKDKFTCRSGRSPPRDYYNQSGSPYRDPAYPPVPPPPARYRSRSPSVGMY